MNLMDERPTQDQLQLLMDVAADEVRTGEGPWVPGYKITAEEFPETYEMCLELARAKAAKQAADAKVVAEVIDEPVGMAPRLVQEVGIPTLEQLVKIRERLNRKFDASDMTPGLRQFAHKWINDWEAPEGDVSGFTEWLADVKESFTRRGTLTDGQAKGILNTATARRPEPKPERKSNGGGITEDGIYLHGETVYKVQFSQQGRLYAKELVIEDGRGRFEYASGMVYKLTPDERMTLEQAKEFGALYGTCCNCGRTLTNEDSIEAGIGPICAGKFLR